MTLDEFIVKWHRVPETCIDGLTLAIGEGLERHDLRLRAECVLATSYGPNATEVVRSNRFNDRSASAVVEEQLEVLDAQLQKSVEQQMRLRLGNPRLGRPVLTVLCGAGFSCAFGLPATAGLREYAVQWCDDPVPVGAGAQKHVFDHAFRAYPLSEFARDGGTLGNIELLLTVWTAWCVSSSRRTSAGTGATRTGHFLRIFAATSIG
jgi:hypothetical protein